MRAVRFQRVGLTVFGAVAILSLVLAAATVWLFLTDPVTVANAVDAVNQGDVSPLLRDLAEVLLQALQGLLKYL
jgi:hypothetical protein